MKSPVEENCIIGLNEGTVCPTSLANFYIESIPVKFDKASCPYCIILIEVQLKLCRQL